MHGRGKDARAKGKGGTGIDKHTLPANINPSLTVVKKPRPLAERKALRGIALSIRLCEVIERMISTALFTSDSMRHDIGE